MSLKGLERLKVVDGNDMYPSIDPKEHLLLDRTAKPSIGDVVLFENRLGVKIAHRLLFSFGGYYFTKGDNCPVFNHPCYRDRVIGVVMGKKREMSFNIAGSIMLSIFLAYFLAYDSLFDARKKKDFITLRMVSKLYPYTKAPG